MTSNMPQPTQQHLKNLRNRLLHLHKLLLDTERNAYEQVHGRVSSGELLRLVIGDEQFAWLRRISELVVQMDEMLQSDEPVSLDDIQNLLAYTRTLLTPSEEGNVFERNYYNAIQREPDVVFAHAEISKLLASSK